MPATHSRTRELLHFAETLLIAAAGGVGFALLGVPAGLVSGSMLATAIAALLGRPMRVPLLLARVCFVLIGMLLGAVVTPATLRGIGTWPLSIAVLAFSTCVMILATTSYLRFVHRWDTLSALLGASPGSMAQVITMAAEYGSDVRGVAIVQTMRVLLVTIALPAGLAFFGLTVSSIILGPVSVDSSPWELAVLAVVSTVSAIVMLRVGVPGGLLFGGMFGSAALHGFDLIHAVLPWYIGSSAVVILGAVAGSRFANTTPRMMVDYLWAALGSAAVAVAVASIFVMIVVTFLPFRTADVVIAFAPGAQDTMMVLALALHLDPVYVGAHHLARWLVVTFSVAFSARRLRSRSAGHEGWKRPGQGTFDD